MGGQIGVISKINKGTKFTFEINIMDPLIPVSRDIDNLIDYY